VERTSELGVIVSRGSIDDPATPESACVLPESCERCFSLSTDLRGPSVRGGFCDIKETDTMKNMIGIEPLQIEIDREEDGRFLASVPDLPGVMAYDTTRDGAIRKAKSIALQVLSEMIESGEEVPAPLKLLFAA